MANLFALTNPRTGNTGYFTHLGTNLPGRVCVQECIVEHFGVNKVFLGSNLNYQKGKDGRRHLVMTRDVSWFETPAGPFVVERIRPQDARYLTSPIIKEYADFFGSSAVKQILSEGSYRTDTTTYQTTHRSLRKKVMEKLGLFWANIVKMAAKRKHKK